MEPYTKKAGEVIDQESIRIGKTPDKRRVGLAFSGGGIRSASFGMGVMQSMVADDKLQKMDYLSTVSGGGFLGSSFTWFLSQKMENGEPYGTRQSNFPFGRKREGNKENDRNSILDFIRQHGNYLIPGKGLNSLSLVAITLRTMLVSFAVYFGLATSAVCLILEFLPEWRIPFVCLGILITLATLWVGTSALYSLYTFFKGSRYRVAVSIQLWLGRLINWMIIFLVLGLLPLIHENMAFIIYELFDLETDPDALKNKLGVGVSSSTVIIGAILAVLSHLRQMQSTSKDVSPLQIIVASMLLLFGMLYGAYVAGLHLHESYPQFIYLLIPLSLFFGFVCNVNYFGLNRMYRDRLMETFMPNRENTRSGNWGLATKANNTKVEDMCSEPNQRPYHLVNCNIVLIDSDNAKYRGRKGDSFTVSPLYCGSDATGWRATSTYMHNSFRNGLTVPTAMAISGAAANPNTGVAGSGITTNRFISTLMSLLNLRLGFWANNPKTEKSWLPPNYIYPGIKGGVLGSGLNENDRAIELTDGGHFENLAIYELLRRRLDLIIVSDAGADGKYTFSDLANAVERVRVDFGINIVFYDQYPLEDVMPDSNTNQSEIDRENYHFAKQSFAIAKIEYTKENSEEPRRIGHLIYIKPTLIHDLSADILGYKKLDPTYPHQTTLDQFFNEQQFEAYRELGYCLGWQMLDDPRVRDLLAETAVVLER